MSINVSSKDSTNFYEGFMVYVDHEVVDNKTYVYLYGRLRNGKSFCTKNLFKPYFYVRKKDFVNVRELVSCDVQETSKKNFADEPLVKLTFNNPDELFHARKILGEKAVESFESDIKPEYRFIIDLNLKGSLLINGLFAANKNFNVDCFFDEPVLEQNNWRPKFNDLKLLSLDIETSMSGDDFYCVSLVSSDDSLKKVLFLADSKNVDSLQKKLKNVEVFSSEKDLYSRFKQLFLEFDPDVITGWNLIDFDFDYLFKRMNKLGVSLDFSRNKKVCKLKITDSFMTDSKADFPGRVVLDGIHLLKSSFIRLDDYKLGTASKAFLKREKLIDDENKGENIEDAYKKEPQKLIDYNLNDSVLVIDILKESGVFELTILRSLLTGMPLDRVRASIASFDSLYIRKLNSFGYVAPSSKFVNREQRTTGGFVMEPLPGIYDFVAVLDFKSLYPSIIRTFNIDPLRFKGTTKNISDSSNFIVAPNGACFSREQGLLPLLIKDLWSERESARLRKDNLTRQAIKILMNSMYGVIASPNCRFYNFDMANAITSFGHMLIKHTAGLVEKKGLKVIYGDTDSIFVVLNVSSKEDAFKVGRELQVFINDYYKDFIFKEYKVQSFTELEFEKVFKKFLMPRVRGGEGGAKKRYAGLIMEEHGSEFMDFTGLEFVRRDWTELSKNFQLGLLEKVFSGVNPASFIVDFVGSLKKGDFDDLLVYRKSLRKDVDDYTKTTPPHVKAARLLDKITSNIIEYVLTVEGPEPLSKVKHSIDYEHYVDKQIKPLADSVLGFYGTSFDDILKGGEQKSLSDW